MRHWGPEADLWSLGMVTYQMLSGGVGSESSHADQVLSWFVALLALLVRSVLACTVHLVTATANGQCRSSVGTVDHVKGCRLTLRCWQVGAIKL